MTEVTTIKPRSVLVDMATRYGMEPAAFEQTVRATCMPVGRDEPPATREEFAAFLLVAREHNLNPVTREIYAMRRKGGGIIPVVSVDGWIRKINEHPAFDGMEFTEHSANGALISTTCSIWRKDRTRPTVVTEYLSECLRGTDAWKMKHRMLRHKAAIQCARYAFGFAGIYDDDEAERIAQASVTPPRPPAPVAAATATVVDDAAYTEVGARREVEGPAAEQVAARPAAPRPPRPPAPAPDSDRRREEPPVVTTEGPVVDIDGSLLAIIEDGHKDSADRLKAVDQVLAAITSPDVFDAVTNDVLTPLVASSWTEADDFAQYEILLMRHEERLAP